MIQKMFARLAATRRQVNLLGGAHWLGRSRSIRGRKSIKQALGPYWSKLMGKTEFTAFQASSRGGVVRVCVKGDHVILGGQAVTVLREELAG
jgi:hypothetical protein